MRRRITRATALAASATLVAACLAGCGSEVMKADEKLDTSDSPALTTQQVNDVLDALGGTMSVGDKDRTRQALEERFAEPALTMREAQYNLNAKNNELAVPQLVTKAASVTVSSNTGFPRVILDVTEAPEGRTPLVLLAVQPSARENYKLAQWMYLIPGQSVPSTAAVAAGAHLVPGNDAKTGTMSPNAAKDSWAGAVKDEKAQKEAGFEADEYMKNIRDEQKSWQEAIGDSGTLAYDITPAKDAIAVRDEDGGVLVATSYTYRTDVAIKSGEGGIQMGGDVGTLLGEEGKVTGKAHWTYTLTVLIHVPAAGNDKAAPRVIAGEKVLTEAARD